jgi:hypothetical protein
MDMVCQPLAHAGNFYHKVLDPENLATHGTPGCRMVCGKARKLWSEFETVFIDRSWIRDLAADGAISLTVFGMLLNLAVELALHAAAAYCRRIFALFQRFSLASSKVSRSKCQASVMIF